jgi:hypothetical protein
MGTDRNRKRIEKIENSLTPREVVALWVEGLAKFNSLEDYISWIAEDSSRAPLPKMLQQIESGIAGRPNGQGKNSSDKNSSGRLLRKRSSEVVFLYNLLLQINLHVHEFVGLKEFHVATLMFFIQAVNERAGSRMAMFEQWKGLHDTPYPLDPDTAAAVSAALRNGVTSFAGLVAYDDEESSESVCQRLERAVDDLCRRGLVQRGWRVKLGPSPLEFLAAPPLVDGVWIEMAAVELAEFAATLCERGITLEPPADLHPLALWRPYRRKEISGEQVTEVLSEGEIANAHAEAAARLATFAGRTKEIDARPYIHLDDYRAWSGRKAGDELKLTEGVVTASWNAWVEASGDCTELAGIQVSKVDHGLKDEDFFCCQDPARRRRREEMASLIRVSIVEKGVSALEGLLQGSRVDIYRLLTEVRATVTATQRLTARYFPGQKILFKSYANALDHLTASVTRLVDDYNGIADYIKAEGGIIFDAGFGDGIEKIDKDADDKGAQERSVNLVSSLVASAQAEMLAMIHEGERALEILKPFVRGGADQMQEPHR